MTQLIYILLAIGVGIGSALQVGFIGSIGKLRGATEAAWISALGTVFGLALAFSIESLRGASPNLPAPFHTIAPFAAAVVLAGVAVAFCVRGLDPYLAITGVFGLMYLYGAGFLAPKIGIALFAGSVTTGTLAASVGIDHFGAFGNTVQKVSVVRVIGVIALLAGVALVRSGR